MTNEKATPSEEVTEGVRKAFLALVRVKAEDPSRDDPFLQAAIRQDFNAGLKTSAIAKAENQS